MYIGWRALYRALQGDRGPVLELARDGSLARLVAELAAVDVHHVLRDLQREHVVRLGYRCSWRDRSSDQSINRSSKHGASVP